MLHKCTNNNRNNKKNAQPIFAVTWCYAGEGGGREGRSTYGVVLTERAQRVECG